MKHFAFTFFTHFFLIFGSLSASWWMAYHGLWWNFCLLMLAALAVCYRLYLVQSRDLRDISYLLRSIHTDSAIPRLTTRDKSRDVGQMTNELTRIMLRFQDKMIDGETQRIFYETLLDQLDTAVFICLPNRKVEWCNRAAHKPGMRFAVPAEWMAPMGDEPRIVTLHPEGKRTEFLLTCRVMEIRKSKRYLLTLKNVQSVLEKNETEAWHKLIRVLNHEIVNSITPIASIADTLCERAAAAEESPSELYELMVQAMQTIHHRSEGLLQFIENYRKLTQIPPPMAHTMHLSDLAAHLAGLYAAEEVRFRVEPPEICLYADREQVEQVLINLIKNAVEACRGMVHPHIEVLFRREETGETVITVSDNGKGILPDVMERIFVPFFTTKENGSGIGLSICKQIMTLHGGSIRVTSEADRGSCFTLSFPPGGNVPPGNTTDAMPPKN